ncbi:MAG: ABC transporter permease, partial [Actinomycetota bacterium]
MLSRLLKRNTGTQPAAGAVGQPAGRGLSFDWRQYVVFIAFVVVFVLFGATLYDSGFLSPNNLLNIVRQSAIIAIMAVAMTFVISAAEIDLSVGSVAGLASVLSALAVSEYGLVAGIAAGLLTGLVVGSINGVLVAAIRIPSFLVTLGMLGIAVGTARWITDSAPVPILDDAFNNIFGSGQIGPIPSLLIWMALIFVAGHFILRKTAFGRRVLATGGNESAARFSGVNT